MNNPIIIAHRGASGDFVENTIPAFLEAWNQKADGIEGDFHLTKDSIPVCIHDEDTERMTGIKRIVKDCSLSELKSLKIVHSSLKESFATIPTLEEILKIIPEDKLFYLELKGDEQMVQAIIPALRKSRLKINQLVVLSFSLPVLNQAALLLPDAKRLWLYEFVPENPIPEVGMLVENLKNVHASGLSVNFIKEQSEKIFHLVEYLKNKGFEFHVWNGNFISDVAQLFCWGADSITTDYPMKIKKYFTDTYGFGNYFFENKRVDRENFL